MTKVMIIDNNPDNRDNIAMALKNPDYVTSTLSPHQMQFFDAAAYDLIIINQRCRRSISRSQYSSFGHGSFKLEGTQAHWYFTENGERGSYSGILLKEFKRNMPVTPQEFVAQRLHNRRATA